MAAVYNAQCRLYHGRMLDILIPTYNRPEALAITLLSLIWQDFRDFRVVIADQSEKRKSTAAPEVAAVLRVMRAKGIRADIFDRIRGKGIAANRDFLLSASEAKYCLFLDDDLILEPDMTGRLMAAMMKERCGFIGSAPIGLSFLGDFRPWEQAIEFWKGRVKPERVRPGTPQWERHKLHNAANIFHVQSGLRLTGKNQRLYKIAWIGSCVLYDSAKLRGCGGFGFWRRLPGEVCGEDVYAQIQMMERFGGCGLIPSGVYHQELPTTVRDRTYDAPKVLEI